MICNGALARFAMSLHRKLTQIPPKGLVLLESRNKYKQALTKTVGACLHPKEKFSGRSIAFFCAMCYNKSTEILTQEG